MQRHSTPRKRGRDHALTAATRVASLWKRVGCSVACVIVLLMPNTVSADLGARDLDTQTLERKVGDDPRAAIREGEIWQQQALQSGNKAQLLRALRLMVMANAQLEDNVALEKSANEGLILARELRDPQAESEFLAGKAGVLSSAGTHIDAQALFDEAISVAEKAGLIRAATSAMVSKAFVYGLLGRDTDSLDLLFKAHQRFVELGDVHSAGRAMSSIGAAYARDNASRENLQKALTYHLQSITPGAEKHSRHELADVYFNIGAVYQRLKEVPNATIYIQKSIALFRALNDPVGLAFGNYRLGVLAGESGTWDEALTYLDNALPELAKSGDATMVFNAHRARAKALAHLDRRRESLDALAKADVIRKRIESSWIETTYLTAAVEVYAKLGDFEKAYRTQMMLVEAERRSVIAAREKDAAEVQTRFEVKQK